MKLFVGNLAFKTDQAALRREFEQYGRVRDVLIKTDRNTGKPRGFAFVTMADATSAKKAIQALDKTNLDGRTIHVNPARESV